MPYHLQAFLAVRRLQHGDLGHTRVVAAVLLVLGGVHARVVRDGQHQPGVHPDIGQGHPGVGGHVQPHVFHGHQRPRAAQARPDPHLQGHLLVGRPLAIDIGVCGQFLQYLRGRRPGIGGSDAHARAPRAQGDRLVAGQQGPLHCITSFSRWNYIT